MPELIRPTRYSMARGEKVVITLDSCLRWLKRESGFGRDWAQMKEHVAVATAHLNIGQILRNEFSLWNPESDLAVFFQGWGITHADDMSAIILRVYHRKLNGRSVHLRSLLRQYATV